MILVTLLWIYCIFLSKDSWSCTEYSDTVLLHLVRYKCYLFQVGVRGQFQIPFALMCLGSATRHAEITQYNQVCLFLCCNQAMSSQFASETVSDPKVPDLTFHYINFQPVSIIPNLEVTYLLLQDILALSALGMGPNCISWNFLKIC